MTTPEIRQFWTRFCDAHDVVLDYTVAEQFGDSSELAEELCDLILSGRKRATCSLRRWYKPDGSDLPRRGDLSIVLDGRNMPRCVIQTLSVSAAPIHTVTEDFAFEEGEGDRSKKYWLEVHRAFFKREAAAFGFEYSDDMVAVFERFECVWKPE